MGTISVVAALFTLLFGGGFYLAGCASHSSAGGSYTATYCSTATVTLRSGRFPRGKTTPGTTRYCLGTMPRRVKP